MGVTNLKQVYPESQIDNWRRDNGEPRNLGYATPGGLAEAANLASESMVTLVRSLRVAACRKHPTQASPTRAPETQGPANVSPGPYRDCT